MANVRYLISLLLGVGISVLNVAGAGDEFHIGPLYDRFSLTLAPGHRTEWFGPAFETELRDTQRQWAFPPLGMSRTVDPDVESGEFDLLYPVLTYDLFGSEYRWQFLQLFNFAGGGTQAGADTHRFTLFPVYFQQRSTDPANNYTLVVPIYGTLRNHLYRDEIFMVSPFYTRTKKRDITTWNMPFPFFHIRKGDGLSGWQLWPIAGSEHKVLTLETNGFGETETNGGHDHFMLLWPFFTDSKIGLGTENPARQQGLLPLYSFYRSPLRDSTSIPWPIGVTHTVDREKKYEEWDAPWPLVEFAHGEGKTTKRIWPLFSKSHNQFLEDDWYLWPVYKYNRLTAPPAYRERTRILFYLYSSVNQTNTETGRSQHRADLWPLFSHWTEYDGSDRWQALSILEPIFPMSKSIARDYGPLYSIWRAEHNAVTGASSQSLLWNLWRRETASGGKNISLLFGLFQYQSSPDGARWRVFYLPAIGGVKGATNARAGN